MDPSPARHAAAPSPKDLLRPIGMITASLALLRTVADPDLWGHVRFGLDKLQSGVLTQRETYSFTSDLTWINHEWLSEVILAFAFARLGTAGLFLLHAALVAAVLGIVHMSFRGTDRHWYWGAMAVVSTCALPLTATIRPQLWTWASLAVVCALFNNGRRATWAIPLLFVPWANFHGGWVVGIGVVAAWLAGGCLDRRQVAWRDLALLGLTVLATLATPYGLELWRFVGTTVRLNRADITEWAPLWQGGGGAILAPVGLLWVFMVWRHAGRLSWSTLSVILLLALAAAQVARLVPLMAVAAVLLTAPNVRRALPRRATADREPMKAALDAAAVVAVLGTCVFVGSVGPCVRIDGGRASTAEITTLRALRSTGEQGRLATVLDWGERAIWELGPQGIKVSIDGRRETIYSPRVLATQYSMLRGERAGLVWLEREQPEYVWLPLPTSAVTQDWLLGHGYRLDIETTRSFLAVRTDRPIVSPSTEFQATRCFPGSALTR